ncbi:hypothetical protein EIP86_002030 [Pleurotus ostreatoroseus]|nr:hypothetical protein EIP86_002030 [Pleurotus ostreatoroseus]
MKSLFLSLLATVSVLGQNLTHYDSYLRQGQSTTKFLGPNAGFFYTDANGGAQDGSATRAGFFLESGYYYVVKDVEHFNTGVSITARNGPQREGFCGTADCEDVNCVDAFTSPPTAFSPPGAHAPSPPLFECLFSNLIFDIVFCPSGVFPGQPQTWEIHPGLDEVDKCLDVRGDALQDGTAVQIYDCNGTPAQRWNIQRGNTKIHLASTNFCLDAGSNPASGVGMKIWQCFDNLPAQQWYYTDDNRIAVENQGQCLDLTNGVLTNGNQVQSWACTANNDNQVWTLSAARPPGIPLPSTIHPNGNTAKCLDIRADYVSNGTPVQIYDCNGTPAQEWLISPGSTKIQLNGTSFCVDASSAEPSNGQGMKIWQCYAGLAAQQWYYTDDERIALEGQGLSDCIYLGTQRRD